MDPSHLTTGIQCRRRRSGCNDFFEKQIFKETFLILLPMITWKGSALGNLKILWEKNNVTLKIQDDIPD